jgi:hypothetical protein
LHERAHAAECGTDLKTLVPVKYAEVSRRFYSDLGFTINWSNDQIADTREA